MIEDYAKHAAVWDWDGYDNSIEYDYWCNYANKYGKKILIPMCALGQVGAYMAGKGFSVTAFDFSFIATQDLHLLSDIKMVEKAFKSISEHLRNNACLALELVLPSSESYEYPAQTFYPRVPNYLEKKVWKEGKGSYDAVTKKHYIDQIVYIQDSEGTRSFNYSVTLQYFERNEILDALDCAGFTVIGEYCNRNREFWSCEDQEWIIEAVKR